MKREIEKSYSYYPTCLHWGGRGEDSCADCGLTIMFWRPLLLGIFPFALLAVCIVKQCSYLADSKSSWILLSVGCGAVTLLGLRFWKATAPSDARTIDAFDWLWLLTALLLGVVAVYCQLAYLGTAVGVLCGIVLLSRWSEPSARHQLRPLACLLMLVAWPTANEWPALHEAFRIACLRSTGWLLDFARVPHVVESNIIDGLQTAVAWHSISDTIWFPAALLAVSTLIVVWLRLRWLPILFLLPSIAVISFATLVLRMACIIAFDLTTEPPWLEPVLFAVGLYVNYCMISLVRFGFDPIRGRSNHRLVTGWNRWTMDGAKLEHGRVHREAANKGDDRTEYPKSSRRHKSKLQRRRKSRHRVAIVVKRLATTATNGLEFLLIWLQTRRYQRLIPLLPVLCFGMVVSGNRSHLPWQTDTRVNLVDLYDSELHQAIDAKDMSRISILLRRLESFSALSPATRYQMAIAYVAVGNPAPSEAIIKSLADDSANPYPAASLWCAKYLLASSKPSVNTRIAIKKYLRTASTDTSCNDESQWILGRLQLQDGDEEAATKSLNEIKHPRPEMLTLLARLYKRNVDSIASLRCANRAELICREQLKQNDQLTPLRLILVDALMLQSRFADALDALESASDYATNSELRDLAIAVDVAWCRELPPEQVADRLSRLEHALAIDRDDPRIQPLLFSEIVRSNVKHDDPIKLLAWSVIESAKANGTLIASSLTALGTLAAEEGDLISAEAYFRQSLDAGNRSPVMLNNLAWILVQQDGMDARVEALEMVNLALTEAPSFAELWKTRAEIWYLQGRLQDAITDLEQAIKCGDRTTEVRDRLATLYDRLGDATTAALYRDRKK